MSSFNYNFFGPYQVGYTMTQQAFSGGAPIKKKPRSRVARLIPRKVDTNEEESPKIIPQPTFNSPDLAQLQYQNFNSCPGTINKDSISFKLPPMSSSVLCQFKFEYSIHHRVVVNIIGAQAPIPFNINDIPFSFTGIEIDITDQIQMGQNRLIFNTLSTKEPIVACIQWKESKNVESFVQKIITEFPLMEIPPDTEFISEIDPILRTQITVPGRGVTCTHAQCFDIRNFLNKAFETGHWECPVCGVRLTFNDLRYDPQFIKNCGTSFVNDDYFDTGMGDYF
jgi:hypothetical protein